MIRYYNISKQQGNAFVTDLDISSVIDIQQECMFIIVKKENGINLLLAISVKRVRIGLE
ncbi:hypothetical protein [Paenibacillus illinoisensis]|uniref:hypothetical protein n=1 Tax=Paenibacillus illinoisensis TaxID=59845 RepID=UPI00301DEF4C